MPGSPVTSGYYGVRRSFLSDSDFHNSKQFSNDVYTPSVGKPFPCESSAGQSHAALLEPYFSTEPYGDYRPPALTPNAGSLFGASPLPPLLPPPFPGDPTHLVFVSMQGPDLVGGVTDGQGSPSGPAAVLGIRVEARSGPPWRPLRLLCSCLEMPGHPPR
ncbi:POU domain class 2-associating factor 2 [Saguinus oedipus]|uniref:POU domain class 2-associating factor 2 n=1 Tax=Saguinus oedipus TaxID=9490 RepID=A0ABQ9USG6_SAGOE|nr:POU domain class 2-associating factor 2 [Saguinus oedipus]